MKQTSETVRGSRKTKSATFSPVPLGEWLFTIKSFPMIYNEQKGVSVTMIPSYFTVNTRTRLQYQMTTQAFSVLFRF